MANSGPLPHDGVVQLLRTSGIPNFDWTNGPYYKEAPEAVLTGNFPYIVYDMKYVGRTWTFTDLYQDEWELDLKVYSYEAPTTNNQDIGAISSPYGSTSISPVAFLEHQTNRCANFSTTDFNCNSFMLKSYDVELDSVRGPDATRVWIGHAVWKMTINADLP